MNVDKKQMVDQKLAEIFSVVLTIDDGEDPTSFQRINERRWDSLAHASIIAAIESEFVIELSVHDWDQMNSFENTSLLILEKIN